MATSGFNYSQLRGNPYIDPTLVDKIMRDPGMLSEQGSYWLSGWGGPQLYLTLARLPTKERLVYAAVLEGYSDATSIAEATGLSGKETSSGLGKLQAKGLVAASSIGEV